MGSIVRECGALRPPPDQRITTRPSVSGWLLLAIAIVAEVAATLALRQSRGFTELLPSLAVVGGYVIAFYMLSLALRKMELGIAYAVWSGVGTATIFLVGIMFLGESTSPVKIVSIIMIVVGVLGLNLVGERPA